MPQNTNGPADTTNTDATNTNVDAAAVEVDATNDEVNGDKNSVDYWKQHARRWENQSKANLARITETEEAAKKWKEHTDSQKSEQEKLQEELAAARLEAQEFKSSLLKREVAEATGIKPEATKFLKGSTKEELEESAKELLEIFGAADSADKTNAPRTPQPLRNQGVVGGDRPKTDREKFIEAMERA